MSDSVKVAGICMSAVACIVLSVVYAFQPVVFLRDLAIAFGGVFGAFFGFPFLGKGVSKLVK